MVLRDRRTRTTHGTTILVLVKSAQGTSKFCRISPPNTRLLCLLLSLSYAFARWGLGFLNFLFSARSVDFSIFPSCCCSHQRCRCKTGSLSRCHDGLHMFLGKYKLSPPLLFFTRCPRQADLLAIRGAFACTSTWLNPSSCSRSLFRFLGGYRIQRLYT